MSESEFRERDIAEAERRRAVQELERIDTHLKVYEDGARSLMIWPGSNEVEDVTEERISRLRDQKEYWETKL